MNITINVPNEAIKLQYCVMDADGTYEIWKPVVMGDFISIAQGEKTKENAMEIDLEV